MENNIDIRDKVNSLLDNHYLVLINKKYGGFNLSECAIDMILNKFPNIPDLKNREVREYHPNFDFQFWNKTVRTNQEIVKFLLEFILSCNNIFIGLDTLSGNYCSLDIVFVPMVDGEPIPYCIEEMDGVENVVSSINQENIIEELCSHIDIMKQKQDGAAAADNFENLSFYTKIILQYGKIPDFIKCKPSTLINIFEKQQRDAFQMNRGNMYNNFMPRLVNMNIRNANNDAENVQDGNE